MGSPFYINHDGSVTQSSRKAINNIDWLDYKQYKGKFSFLQIIFLIVCVFPVYGWIIGLISWSVIRKVRGYWPFIGIRAIENSNEPIKVYCNDKGLLGLYTKKQRITSAKYISIQSLPTVEYPTYILESNGKYCLYNYTQGKILFKDSDKITFLGDNIVLIKKDGKESKYSVIGMRID